MRDTHPLWRSLYSSSRHAPNKTTPGPLSRGYGRFRAESIFGSKRRDVQQKKEGNPDTSGIICQMRAHPVQLPSHTHLFMKTSDLMDTLDDIPDAVVRLDGQGKCVTMNQAAVQIFRRLGRDPGRTIGKSVWELFPDLKGTVAEQHLRRALDDQRPIQHELYSPADQRWYDAQGFPSSPGVVLIFRDITEWKTGHSSEPNHTR